MEDVRASLQRLSLKRIEPYAKPWTSPLG
jgi:hypothetical protein